MEDIDDNVDEDAMDIDEQDFDDMAKEGATTTTKKKKTASETYTKVSILLFACKHLADAWVALSTGAHSETTGFLHRQRGVNNAANVDLGCG